MLSSPRPMMTSTMDTGSNATTPARRNTQSRSVWGCLTCRRRKVKCRSREVPCETCRRLCITCTPSFHSNFKESKWKATTPRSSSTTTTIPAKSAPVTATPAQETSYASPSLTENSMDTSFTAGSCDTSIRDESVAEQTATGTDAGTPVAATPGGWTVEINPWSTDAPPLLMDDFASRMAMPAYSHGGEIPPRSRIEEIDDSLPLGAEHYTAPMTQGQLTSIQAPTVAGFVNFETLPTNSLSDMGSVHMSSLMGYPFDMTIPLTMRPSSPGIDEGTLVDYYQHHLSGFFSSKMSTSTSWNFYTYALNSTEGRADSPLRHSILAWSSAHLIHKQQVPSRDTLYRHYTRAKAATNDLLAQLTGENAGGSSMSPQATSKALSMLLSTSLFLSFCDIVTADIGALWEGLSKIRTLLVSQWGRMRENLGPLDSRILVWLAYIDLRSNFWVAAQPSTRIRPSGNSGQEAVAGRGELFNFLMTQKGVASLRSNRSGGRYYLTECFGSSYPEKELRDDLAQEPAKLLSDESLTIFSRILAFETWEDTMRERGSLDELLIQELRRAKLQALRADIARVRAECKVIHADLRNHKNHNKSTEHLCLTTTALHLSATILLSRTAAPHARTDEEAQSAARGIVSIARRLKKMGFHVPRSLMWPIPIFIAGIEVVDEIYQDWILDYMDNVAKWGYSTKNATELLRRIMEEQDKAGRRIKVRDVMNDFAHLAGEFHVFV